MSATPEVAVHSAQGIDVSKFNKPLTAAALAGLDFAYTKATDGPAITDPDLPANWKILGQEVTAGKLVTRGVYHEMWSAGSAAVPAQAGHFMAAAKAAGLNAGDMLGVVASDYQGVTDAEVLAFCTAVRAAAGPHHPILVYTDLEVAKTLLSTSAAGFDLWVAWPNLTAPGPAQWAPAHWKTWRLWQWGIQGTDRDAFNGTRADLVAWIKTFLPAPKPPAPAPVPVPAIAMADTLVLDSLTATGPAVVLPVPSGKTHLVLLADGYRAAVPPKFRVGFGPGWHEDDATPAWHEPAVLPVPPKAERVTIARLDTGSVPVTVAWA